MARIPAAVATYLRDHAPRGNLLGWWLDQRRDFIVLILYQRDGGFRVSVGAFPEVVGHWGHDLGGNDCDLRETRLQLQHGHWDADAATTARLLQLVDRLEAGRDVADLLDECRAIYDPQGITVPREPPEPRRGPSLTNEAQFRVVSALVAELVHPNHASAADAAAKLAAMGINENDGPLFAREALMKYRKGRQ